MVTDKPNINYKKNEIIHTPSIYNPTYGLAINGTTWSIDYDGSGNFKSLKIGNETLDVNKNFDDRYVQLTGGNISGDITTSNTVFNNNSLITKLYVDSAINTLSENIDLSLFIPNEGNDMDDVDLELVRKSFSLESDEITLKNKTLTLATKTGNNITDKSILDDGSLQIYKFDSSNTLLADAYISTNGFGVNRTIDDIPYRSRHEYNKLYITRDDLNNTGSIEFKVDDDQVMYIQNNKNSIVRYTYLNLDTAELYLTKGSDYFRLNTNQIYISSNTLHKYFASFLNEQDNLTKIALSGPNNYLEISPVYLKMGHASGSNAYFDVNLYDNTENLLSLEKGYEYVDGLSNYSSDMQLNIKRDKFEFIYDADRTYNNETVKYKGELLLTSALYFKSTTNAGSNKSLFYDAGTFSVGLAHSNFSITQSRIDYSTTNNKTSLAITEGLYDIKTSDDNYELDAHAQYDVFYLYSKRKSDNKKQYELQLTETNSWIKSETENWEFNLSSTDAGLTWNSPSSIMRVSKYQIEIFGKDANSGNYGNTSNDLYDLLLNPGGINLNTKAGNNLSNISLNPGGIVLNSSSGTSTVFNISLNPGGSTISTESSSYKTYLNLTMGTIESKSTWDDYVGGIAAHKVYASGGEFYTLAKNPGGYAYQYTNYAGGFSGIKLLSGSTLQQFSISDRGYSGSSKLTTDYESFENVISGLQYEWYYSKDSTGTVNSDGFNTDNNYCKFLATNGNFGYDYNYKDNNSNLTVSSIHLNPNNFNVTSSHTDNYGENFALQAHYNQFEYSSISNTYTYGETTTRNSTQTTLLQTTSTGGLHYSIETSNYTSGGTYVNLGLIINTSTIDIYAGDGNYVPKSRLYMTPTTAKITGEYNSNTYTLEWKWMQGPTLGLYASSTDGYTPVLKGFKIYDENDNLLSDSYLPNEGNTLSNGFFALTRSNITINAGAGATLTDHSNISMTDTRVDVGHLGGGYFAVDGNNHRVEIQQYNANNTFGSAIKLVSNNAYLYRTTSESDTQSETSDYEIIRRSDLDDYVSKTEYDELVEKYNDLADRLNQFLMNTGGVEEEPSLPTLTDELITVPTNHVSISLNANNFYLDWGDGSEVETITGNNYVTKTHDYAETKVWKIKIGPNDENATGDIEAYSHENETGTDPNQFTEVNLNHLIYNINDYQSYEDIANSTTLTKYKINYPTTFHQGCGFAFLVNCPNLTEIYFGPLTEGITMGPIEISENLDSNLTSIYLDLDTEVFEAGTPFMFYRQSLTDIYFYNETPISLYYEDGYYNQAYLTDEEFSASQSGETIDVSGLTIHVPSAAVEAYKTAPGWSIYADRIVGDI